MAVTNREGSEPVDVDPAHGARVDPGGGVARRPRFRRRVDRTRRGIALAPIRPRTHRFGDQLVQLVDDRLHLGLAADQILVLDRGRVVDHDTHPGLLQRGGRYGKLYHRQFRPEPARETVPPDRTPRTHGDQ